MIRLKRAYQPIERQDGTRFLVDALWPRGVRKPALHLEGWVKEVAPSKDLRNWFAHDPAKWQEFKQRYWEDLRQRPEAWGPLLKAAERGTITLVFGARDTSHNNAVALKEFLEQHALKGPRTSKARSATRSR